MKRLTKSQLKRIIKEEITNVLNEEDPRVQQYAQRSSEEERLRGAQADMAKTRALTYSVGTTAEEDARARDREKTLDRVQMKLAKKSDKDRRAIVDYARQMASHYVDEQIGDCINQMSRERVSGGHWDANVDPDVEQFKHCLEQWEKDYGDLYRENAKKKAEKAGFGKSSSMIMPILVGSLVSLGIYSVAGGLIFNLLAGLLENEGEEAGPISDEDKDKVVSAAQAEIDKLAAGLL